MGFLVLLNITVFSVALAVFIISGAVGPGFVSSNIGMGLICALVFTWLYGLTASIWSRLYR